MSEERHTWLPRGLLARDFPPATCEPAARTLARLQQLAFCLIDAPMPTVCAGEQSNCQLS